MLNVVVLVINVVSALFLVVFILLHSGRGGGLSDMFGGGGNVGAGTALERRLDRLTVVTAILFGLTTFWLSWQWK